MEINKEIKFELKVSSGEFFAIMEALKESLSVYVEGCIAHEESTKLLKQMKNMWNEK